MSGQMSFYVPGKRWAEDGAVLVDGVYHGLYSRHKTLADFPGAVVISDEEVAARVEALCVTEPEEIGPEKFTYFLEVLPPVAWRGRGSPAESFKLSELTSGLVTQICVRLGDRYFGFQGRIDTAHDACVARVRAAFP